MDTTDRDSEGSPVAPYYADEHVTIYHADNRAVLLGPWSQMDAIAH